jgi:hypothetical protein
LTPVALQLSSSGAAIRSMQHGRNTTVLFPFLNHPPARRDFPQYRHDEWLDEFAVRHRLSALAICPWR